MNDEAGWPGPPIATDHIGTQMVSWDSGHERELLVDVEGWPLAVAVMIATDGERICLVHNKNRDQWELPGGEIEPGESPKEAAVREFAEEAGGSMRDARFVGVRRLRLASGLEVRCALFTGAVVATRELVPNAEIAGVAWISIDDASALGRVSDLDLTLLRRVLRLR
ncbi:NUDIX domain-containing protein [Calidifontibacter sp. DB0510]|uniref:NUDIX domain-containing protein n=1 Tax=Metallococcus carri TaxID=1656884 RepID=A0A967B4D6_9MICO|nr:NUDIX domain-containing protein [Metallococcus carri]NHN54401.1 NUDIX domain-containing protein [Metallococcus carri]NOP36760.1 NUDIX domain-containing protein [Calidifontibacter sp. DB2511S]